MRILVTLRSYGEQTLLILLISAPRCMSLLTMTRFPYFDATNIGFNLETFSWWILAPCVTNDSNTSTEPSLQSKMRAESPSYSQGNMTASEGEITDPPSPQSVKHDSNGRYSLPPESICQPDQSFGWQYNGGVLCRHSKEQRMWTQFRVITWSEWRGLAPWVNSTSTTSR